MAAAAVVLVVIGSPAAAQYGPNSNDRCAALSTRTPPPGGDIDVSGGPGCFDPATFAEGFFIQSEVRIFRVQVTSSGSYTTAAANPEIPRSARPGSASIQVRGTLAGQPVTYSQAITVSGATTGRGTTGRGGVGLPATGGQIAMLAVWGIGLVAGGSILVSATWRRFQEARVHTSDAEELRFIHPLETPDGEVDAYDLLRAALVRRERSEAPTVESYWTEAYRLADDDIVAVAPVRSEPQPSYSIWAGEAGDTPQTPAPEDPLKPLRAELQAWSS